MIVVSVTWLWRLQGCCGAVQIPLHSIVANVGGGSQVTLNDLIELGWEAASA